MKVSKYAAVKWGLITVVILFLGGLGGLYFLVFKDYSQGVFIAGTGGIINIKTTADDGSDTETGNKRNILTFAQARDLYKDIIYGQLFVPQKPRPQKMEPGDGIDNDYDGYIDEELMDGKDDDGDGLIDEDVKELTDTQAAVVLMFPDDEIDNDKDGRIDEEIEDGIDNDGDGLIDEDLRTKLDNIDVSSVILLGTIKSSKGWKALVKLDYAKNDPNVPDARIVGIGDIIPESEPELTIIDIKENKILLYSQGFENTWLKNEIVYNANPWLLNKSLIGDIGKKDSSWSLKFRHGGDKQ